MAGAPVTDVAAIWMTCAPDLTEHAVAESDFVAGRERGDGVYDALCGAQVVVASMLSAPAVRCPACARFVCARASLVPVEQRLGGRPSHHKASRIGRALRRWTR